MWQDAFETERLIELARELSKKGYKPGTDNMTGKSAELWLKVNGDNLKNVLLSGKYTPMPLTGFRVTKKGGGFRRLTRLTAIDTCIQKSLALELEDYCGDRFSDSSFAYRKNRGAGAALARFCELGSVYRFASKLDPSDR